MPTFRGGRAICRHLDLSRGLLPLAIFFIVHAARELDHLIGRIYATARRRCCLPNSLPSTMVSTPLNNSERGSRIKPRGCSKYRTADEKRCEIHEIRARFFSHRAFTKRSEHRARKNSNDCLNAEGLNKTNGLGFSHISSKLGRG